MPANLVITGARVRTMDPARPLATAVAIRGGDVVAVGDELDVRGWIDSRTEVVDARGACLTPGFVDGHQHLFHGAVMARGIDFDRVESLARMRELIHARRSEVGAGQWVQGFALAYEAFEGAEFHHRMIDDAAGAGPLIVYSLDVHTAFVNAEALRRAGIDGPRSFPDGSIIVCDEHGRPTGELRETSAMDLVAGCVPQPSSADRRQWYRETMAAQNAVGLTGIQMMDGDPETADLLAAMEAEDDLALRVFLHQFVYPTTSDDAFAAILAAGTKAGKESGRRWRADGVKFMIDGVIDTGTAWLDEPDLQGAGVEPMWPDVQRFRSRVAQAHAAGLSVATHAIGDRGVRETLDAYAGLPGGPQGRCRVEHIEMVPDATLKRFAAESVVASVQPSHVRWLKPDLSDPWSRRLDVPRCSHAFRSGDIVASGALTVLGSDWPVAPFDPRQGFFAAQARRAHDVDDERPIGASASMSGEQALAGYTRNSALAAGEGDRAGLIREGYRADLVLWAEDPSQVAVRDVVQLPVLLTVVDGVAVFRGER